jgi:hypothetical protein
MLATRERKARNHLKNLGYKLEKTPPRHWTRGHYPVGYIITCGIATVAGDESDIDGPGTCRDYTLTIEAVEEFIADLAAREVEKDLRNVLATHLKCGGNAFRFVEASLNLAREAA